MTVQWLPEQERRLRALREAKRLLHHEYHKPDLNSILRVALYITRGEFK